MSSVAALTETYDRNYIKHEINLDEIIEAYRTSAGEKKAPAEPLFDEETTAIIDKVNELARLSPSAVKPPKGGEVLPTVLARGDTKEYRKPVPSPAVPAPASAAPSEKRAQIFEVREYVQTSLDTVLQNPGEKADRRFVVNMPDTEETMGATVISASKEEAEEVTFDDVISKSDITQEEIENYFKDNLFSNIKRKISEVRSFEKGVMLHAFDRESDKNHVRQQLDKMTSSKRIGLFFCWVFLLPLLYMGLSQKTGFPLPDFLSPGEAPSFFIPAQLLLFLGVLLCSGTLLKNAASIMVSFRFGAPVLVVLSSLVCVLQAVAIWNSGAALVWKPDDKGQFVYLMLPALLMLLYNEVDLRMAKKLKTDYKLIAFKQDKTCGAVVANPELASQITGHSEMITGHIRRLVKLEIPNFFTRSLKQPAARRFEYICAPISFLGSVGVLAYGLYTGADLAEALGMMAASLLLLTPLCFPILINMPYAAISKRIKLSGAAILGFDAVKSMAGMDELILSDYDLFPAKSVQMSGIKMYNDIAAETAIPLVASVFDYIGGPLAEVFLNVIDNRRELLREVEEARYFDESGIRAIVGGKIVLVGTADFLTKYHVRLPADGVAGKITSAGKTPLFVSFDGKLSAILSVSYQENRLIRKYLKKIVSTGINVNVTTTDPNLSAALLLEKYGLPSSAVRIVPSKLKEGVLKELDKDESIAIVTITKDVSAFLRAQSATIKIRNNISIGMMLSIASLLVGVLFTAFMIFMGDFSLAFPLVLLAIQLIWSIPLLLITYIYKLLA